MPARSAEEKAQRKLLLQQKKVARAQQKAAAAVATSTKETSRGSVAQVKPSPAVDGNGTISRQQNDDASSPGDAAGLSSSLLEIIPDVALHHIMAYLAARDLGCWVMSSRRFRQSLPEARVHYLLTRLGSDQDSQQHNNATMYNNMRICLIDRESEIHSLLEHSLGGDTGRLIVKTTTGKKASASSTAIPSDEFIGYARFIEEVVCGYATIRVPSSPSSRRKAEMIQLPRWVHGRFVSVSPEHTLCRVGGDGQICGSGGSGVASWGVGKRGQLGHGQRQDVSTPKRLMGGIGYGIRIVQVSAGGGLVRVAHSLLLTSMGKVLSFGTGQYGALGHGYNAGKQLPDTLRPQYIEALQSMTCTCVSAGELHSAVVTSDGDVYTWGDGFCGQLGHADKRPRLEPKQVTAGGLGDECVSMISCGSRHTLAVTEDGECWSWGLGHFGVLGRSFTPFDYDADTAIESFQQQQAPAQDYPVVSAAAPPAVLLRPDNDPEDVEAAIMNAADEYYSQYYNSEIQSLEQPQPELHDDNDVVEAPEAAALIAQISRIANLESITNLSLDDSSDQCIPKVIESLQGIKIIGASAGHRHSLVLDASGCLYSFGSGGTGCLGHGDVTSEMHPVRITQFVDDHVQICQMSAGVDISMAVSTFGEVYAWGKSDGGRIGLSPAGNVLLPRKVQLGYHEDTKETIKAVDVDCGYVHSIIVGLDGTIHVCGGVGVDGQDDGQREEILDGLPRRVPNFNIWHRLPEPHLHVKTERWKKYGKYEVKGRSKMLAETFEHQLK